jgi:hypothetical protein
MNVHCACADEAMERAPLPSEGSISISLTREESATAQSAVTEQLAHLSTAPKRMPLQVQPRAAATTAAQASPVPMESSSVKPARKQSQEAQPVLDADWGDEGAVPDEKRLFTVSCMAGGGARGWRCARSPDVMLLMVPLQRDGPSPALARAGADPASSRLCDTPRLLAARPRGVGSIAKRLQICSRAGVQVACTLLQCGSFF